MSILFSILGFQECDTRSLFFCFCTKYTIHKTPNNLIFVIFDVVSFFFVFYARLQDDSTRSLFVFNSALNAPFKYQNDFFFNFLCNFILFTHINCFHCFNTRKWKIKIYHLRPKICRCHCGRAREEHEDISSEERNIDSTHNLDNEHVEEIAWNPDQHLARKETNAYGEIVFHMSGSKSKAKVWLILFLHRLVELKTCEIILKGKVKINRFPCKIC